MLTADHGDCWGEDGLWEHGISHRRTLEVPLLMRVRGSVGVSVCRSTLSEGTKVGLGDPRALDASASRGIA